MNAEKFPMWVLIGVLNATAAWCLAQEPAPAKPPPEDDLRILTLSHVRAKDMLDALEPLKFAVYASAPDESTLIVNGRKSHVERVEQLVKKLDVPGTAEKTSWKTEFIPLGSVETGSLGQALDAITKRTGTYSAMDVDNRMLVVRGAEREIATIRELVKQLDRPAKSYTLHFYFLRGGSTSQKDAGTLPADLKPAASVLASSGFGNPQLLTPGMVVVAEEGKVFEANAEFNPPPDGDAMDRLMMHVEGMARPLPSGSAVQINLQSSVNGRYQRGAKDEGQTMFNIKNTVVAKLGNYAVIAAAPGSTAAGDSIALVVRVTVE